jgi:hypothetical protein
MLRYQNYVEFILQRNWMHQNDLEFHFVINFEDIQMNYILNCQELWIYQNDLEFFLIKYEWINIIELKYEITMNTSKRFWT